MSNINSKTISKEIEMAYERQFEQGHRESICEILESVAGNSFYFWKEFASELHRQKKFNDAFECWCKAELYFDEDKLEKFDWYLDAVLTLIDSSKYTDAPFFWTEALEICSKLRAMGFDQDVWNLTIELLIYLKSEPIHILKFIEEIFIEGSRLTAYVPPASLGLKNIDYVESLSGVAEYYLELDQPSEALRVWGLAVKNNSENFRDELCNAIYMLNQYALKKGFSYEEFGP